MIYLGYILFAMLVIRFLVTLANFFSRPYLSYKTDVGTEAKISVLIPARNEEENLKGLLSDLEKCNYPTIEIIVCNDHSTDQTEQVLKMAMVRNNKLNYFNNNELPVNWIGKNFACDQLALRATGDYYLFLDADVRISPQFISKLQNHITKKKLALLSIFPRQLIVSKGEWKTVPLMNWILLTFLPIRLVRLKWFSSLSAANGQTMVFDAALYRKNRWHEKVKNRNVEDIEIARIIKKQKLPIDLLLGSEDVSCRMYANETDAINGFARNMHQYFGGKRAWMFFFVFATWFRLPILAFTNGILLVSISILIIILMKICVSIMSKQNLKNNILFHFSQLINLAKIAKQNNSIKQKGTLYWKGREYQH
jgi:glycosyltransferase involved in cell wall biosynthesis